MSGASEIEQRIDEVVRAAGPPPPPLFVSSVRCTGGYRQAPGRSMLRVVRSARTWFDAAAMPSVADDHRREVLMWATLGSTVVGVIALYVGLVGGLLPCCFIGGALLLTSPLCGWAHGRGGEPPELAQGRSRCVLEVSCDSITITDEGSTFRVPTRDLTRLEVRKHASRFSIHGFTRRGPEGGRVLLDGLEEEELERLVHALRHEAPVPLPV